MRTRAARRLSPGLNDAKTLLALLFLPLAASCSLLSPQKRIQGDIRPSAGQNQTFGPTASSGSSVNDAWIGRFLASGSLVRSMALFVAAIGATVWAFQAARAAPAAFWTMACKLANGRKRSEAKNGPKG